MKYNSIREFAKRYRELALSPGQEEKRRLWKGHNSFRPGHPLIIVRKIPYDEFFDYSVVKSEDPLLRRIETGFATAVLYRHNVKDDFIYEPWVTVRAKFTPGGDRWGVPCALGERPRAGGAAAFIPPIRDEEDIAKIKPLKCEIDEAATAEDLEKIHEALGGILDIASDRRGIFCAEWVRDIATDVAKLRGLEQIMWDVYDRPEWFHRLIALMRDTILEDIERTEKSGNFRLCNSENQSMAYSEELAAPGPGSEARQTRDLWVFMASQEYTGIGPELFDEFMLQYQKPIMERFGLSAYGCCEDLTAKIPLLKTIRNLRRVSITPFMDVEKSAEQIGKDYIVSYRPKPTDMIANGLDEDLVRKIVKRDYTILKENNCVFDNTLKDVETIASKPENVIRWVDLVRQIGDEVFG